MESLWKKLSPDHRAKIKNSQTILPNRKINLIKSLKEEVFYSNLSVENAYLTLQETTKKEISINNLFELFNIKK
jgi:hypothetical protein